MSHHKSQLLFLFFSLACFAAAQDAPAPAKSGQPAANSSDPAITVSVKVNVINVLTTVRDKHGKIVNNLTQDDFTMSEDGRPQSIHYFSRETDLPLTLGLLVDTSRSQRRVLEQERRASQSFLDQVIRENRDKAFVIHFDRDVELLQDLTSSHRKLEEAVKELKTRQPGENENSGGGGGGGGNGGGGRWPGGQRGGGHHGVHHGGTMLYDAVYLASDELMKKQEGRKAVVVLSDGVDMGSKETLDAAIESAQRANTLVYSILFKDDEAYGNGGGWGGGYGGHGGHRGGGGRNPEQRPDGKKILERLSKETGGRLFVVSKKESVEQIYAQITEGMRNQYNLGYTPDRAANNDSGYHKIQVATKQKDLTVQARDGYYGGK